MAYVNNQTTEAEIAVLPSGTASSALKGLLDAAFVLAFVFVLLNAAVPFAAPFRPFGVVAAVALIQLAAFGRRLNLAKPDAWDAAALIIAAVSQLNFLTSAYPANTLPLAIDTCFLASLFVLVRRFLRSESSQAFLFLLVTVLAAALCVWTIAGFATLQSALAPLRLGDPTNFRVAFPHLPGMLPAESITLFLALLPFAVGCAVRFAGGNVVFQWFGLAVAVLLIVCAWLSFSRAMYVGLAAWFVVAAGLLCIQRFYSRRLILSAAAIAIAASLICVLPFARPVLKTAGMIQNDSQSRSLQGRVEVWKHGLELASRRPWNGWGTGNFVLSYAATVPSSADIPLPPKAFNLPIEIAAERGLSGLLAYAIVGGLFLTRGFRTLRERCDVTGVMAGLFLACFIALLVRDATYSTLLSNRPVAVLLCVMFGLVAECRDAQPLTLRRRASATATVLLAAATTGVLIFPAFRLDEALRHYHSFLSAFRQRNYVAAEAEIQRSLEASPGNAYYRGAQALALSRTGTVLFSWDRLVSNTLLAPADRGPALSALRSYQDALIRSPGDDGFLHNMAWLQYSSLGPAAGIALMRRAEQADGANWLIPMSLGMMYEAGGNRPGALEEYARGLRLAPGLTDSKWFRELTARSPGMAATSVGSATDQLKDELSRSRSPVTMAKLGSLYVSQGLAAPALPLLREATTRLPTLSLAWTNLGRAFRLEGQTAPALRCFTAANLLNPTDRATLDELAKYYAVAGDPALAAELRADSAARAGKQPVTERVVRYQMVYRLDSVIEDDVIPSGLLEYFSYASTNE